MDSIQIVFYRPFTVRCVCSSPIVDEALNQSYSKGTKLHSIGRSANIEPAICNGHLPYPLGRRWREKRVGSWMQVVREGRVGEAKRLGQGRGPHGSQSRVGS